MGLSDAGSSHTPSLWDRLPQWQKIASSVVALGALVVTYLAFFAPIRERDLTVWIRQRIPIALPTLPTDTLPLRLLLGNDTIVRAHLLEVQVTNTGKIPLGADDHPWTLRLYETSDRRVQLIGNVQAKPRNIAAKPTASLDSASIVLSIGLLNPRDELRLRVLTINPDSTGGAFGAESRISGLPAPVVTDKPLSDRVEKAFFLPLAAPIWLVLLTVAIRDLYKRSRTADSTLTVGAAFGGLLAVIAAGALLAYGLAWIAARTMLALTSR